MPVYKDKRRSELASMIDAVAVIERDKLLRGDLSDLGFRSAEEDIDRVQRVMVRLRTCDLDLLPENKFQDCSRFVGGVRDMFGRMQNVSPMRSNTAPQMERDQVLQQFRNLYSSDAERLADIFAL